jgi:hypothetical protein
LGLCYNHNLTSYFLFSKLTTAAPFPFIWEVKATAAFSPVLGGGVILKLITSLHSI